MAPHIFNMGARLRWVVIFTHQLCNICAKNVAPSRILQNDCTYYLIALTLKNSGWMVTWVIPWSWKNSVTSFVILT